MSPHRPPPSRPDDGAAPQTDLARDSEPPLANTSWLERRSVLKLLGLSTLPAALGSAAAAETGYGTGGYGQGSYGGGQTSGDGATETTLAVTTTGATAVTATAATLTGAVTALGGATQVTCAFEWRAAGTSTWTRTAPQSLAAAEAFEHTVTGLTAGTTYEVRAVAETTAATTTGERHTFTTASRPLENTILIDGVGTTGQTAYEFTVSGTAEPTTHLGATIEEVDVSADGHVTGTVTGWRDAFRFSGDLETLTVDGQARVFVNADRVDPADYGGERAAVLTIVGNGTPSEYRATVDGTVEVLEGADVTVADGSATGTIRDTVHRLRFTGELLEFTFLTGGTQVYLDDQRLDPAAYTGATQLPHVIVFDGTDTAEASQYAFTVDEAVTATTDRGATIDAADTVDGTTVDGTVAAGEIDAYRFAGAIDDFQLAGAAAVDIEYNAD